MELIYTGKTKNVYRNDAGQTVLEFKDDVTGEDGKFDPGANQVGLSIEGVGQKNLGMSAYFFEKLNTEGILTHYISSDLDGNFMTVRDAQIFGKGLEVITRYRAVGSFYRRFGDYIEEGAPLDTYMEVTLKDDERGDPFISQDALDQLGILSKEDYETLESLNAQIADFIQAELATKGLELYDLKLEFGLEQEMGQIMLIDEISGGNMRVFKGDESIEPLALAAYFIEG
ncbi:phosphoribosylaminoimidazolesuccinocarboxamide synthase [Suicoccus acidiformans]|uniref:Phosphoribosylaminoimidazole-succinocarboxamide synthase n=1 Tax=Suicoccus acidiformans TaxID=2036206 RepID=A0A347WIA4_9LACT|nr:phosphoribosylaminoimidazolesuccinocarboxamide synthase [Suicoccus acidiformans]AXY24811.1 phosphoribosylaminoimidazolesuccinocarboxamide synthase [Suicoccus acidiformans]